MKFYQRGPNLEVDFRYTNFFLASDPPTHPPPPPRYSINQPLSKGLERRHGSRLPLLQMAADHCTGQWTGQGEAWKKARYEEQQAIWSVQVMIGRAWRWPERHQVTNRTPRTAPPTHNSTQPQPTPPDNTSRQHLQTTPPDNTSRQHLQTTPPDNTS